MNGKGNIIAGCMRWGNWGAQYTTQQYLTLIQQCVEAGITGFDHADIYGGYSTEKEFGNALQQQPHIRQHIQLITKCGIQMPCPQKTQYQVKSYNTSKEYIVSSVHQSLQNFNTDYLDVLLIHRPSPLMHYAEIAEAAQLLLQQGKIKAFGMSNFLPHQVNALLLCIPISYNQVQLSIAQPHAFVNGTLDNCQQHGIAPMAWGCLGGSGFTATSHAHYATIQETAQLLAQKYACSVEQIFIAFIATHPYPILPVIGSTKIERLVEAKEAMSIQLDLQDWFLLYQAAMGKEVD